MTAKAKKKSVNSGLSNIAQNPHFCDTPKLFQETKSDVFKTHIDKSKNYLLAPDNSTGTFELNWNYKLQSKHSSL